MHWEMLNALHGVHALRVHVSMLLGSWAKVTMFKSMFLESFFSLFYFLEDFFGSILRIF
jgi:hypothetical protein